LDALTIKQTVAFTRRFNSQLHFVHVGPAGEPAVDLEKKLFEINYVYADAEMPFIFSKVVGDDVVEGLHQYAYDHRIGLFVFVTHHRSFWDKLMHHSVSKDMLLHTGIPILLIHADGDTIEE
jgi:nucleotide-binding universal stress UspA family protein